MEKCFCGVVVFLFCIHMVALVSLWITAKDTAWEYEKGSWHLSGEEQFIVSSKENVIVFVLDYFSNQYPEPLEAAYPGATDFLHDFAYYSNADCTYIGTFPSMAHLTTGCEIDPALSTADWFEKIWNEEKTIKYYDMLAEKGYKMKLFSWPVYSCGYDINLIKGKVSNIVNDAQDLDINSRLLLKTMIKMSCYCMAPDILKPFFYVNVNDYTDIVTVKENMVYDNNHDFYHRLQEQGLTKDDQNNYYIIQHLVGTHAYETDENGNYKRKLYT